MNLNIRAVSSWLCTILLLMVHFVQAQTTEVDVVIYGGTAAAITAAVQVKRMGKSVVVVSPDERLGGMTSSGLGSAEIGNKEVIGGLTREFYHRVWRYYQSPDVWKWQKKRRLRQSRAWRLGCRWRDADDVDL